MRVFAWLCLHVSGWMGCLFVRVPLGPRVLSALVCLALSPCLRVYGLSVGVPLGLGLCVWVSVCFSVLLLQQPGSQHSHICAVLLDLDSFLPKLPPSHSLGAPLPLTLTSSLDSVLLEVSGNGQREDTRCSVSPVREALSRPRGTSEDRSSPVGLWRLGWLTEL